MNKKLLTIGLTATAWMFILIGAAYASQEPYDIWFDTISALIYLILAGICEWLKYHITHDDNNNTLAV